MILRDRRGIDTFQIFFEHKNCFFSIALKSRLDFKSFLNRSGGGFHQLPSCGYPMQNFNAKSHFKLTFRPSNREMARKGLSALSVLNDRKAAKSEWMVRLRIDI